MFLGTTFLHDRIVKVFNLRVSSASLIIMYEKTIKDIFFIFFFNEFTILTLFCFNTRQMKIYTCFSIFVMISDRYQYQLRGVSSMTLEFFVIFIKTQYIVNGLSDNPFVKNQSFVLNMNNTLLYMDCCGSSSQLMEFGIINHVLFKGRETFLEHHVLKIIIMAINV